MRVAIIGIGLIGGSFALALREALEKPHIFGIDSQKDHLRQALELGLIDEIAELDAVKTADVVLVAVPVSAAVDVIREVLDRISDDTLVIDMGSTKEVLCKALAGHPKRRNFLAAHPIAGTEFSGPKASVHKLFQGKTTVVCEVEKTAFPLQERGLYLFQQLGMKIRYMEPAAHDRHLAYVSHLSHISSFMLGKTVLEKERNERDIFDLAGSGFASTVRLAKSSPGMWTPIFEQNKKNVLEALEAYITQLSRFRDRMEKDDYQGLFQEMEETNHIKTVLKGIS